MVINRLARHLFFIFTIVGIIAVTPPLSEAHIEIATPVESSQIDLSIETEIDEKPLRLTIPQLNIDIRVEETEIIDGTWTVPEHSAGFAEGSALLDEEHGNSIVFAHAREGLFKDLLSITGEAEITILGKNTLYKYKVSSIEKILPDEIDKIKSFGDHHLTLFTCEGWNDEYRLLVKAKRIDTLSLENSKII